MGVFFLGDVTGVRVVGELLDLFCSPKNLLLFILVDRCWVGFDFYCKGVEQLHL